VADFDRLFGTHRDAMESLCSIAARMNPNLALTAVFENDAVLDLDRMIVGKLEEFAQSRPVSPEKTARSSDTKPLVDSPHAKLISFARIGAAWAHEAAQEPATCRIRNQFRQYINECAAREVQDPPPPDINLIDHWLGKRQIWPERPEYALDILMRPVTFASPERDFSLTSRLEGLRRLRLLPEHLEELAMIVRTRRFPKESSIRLKRHLNRPHLPIITDYYAVNAESRTF
jgi:hypothetical protein